MSAFRLCSSKVMFGLIGRKGSPILGLSSILRTQRATLIGIDRKDPEIDRNKPKPWPYKKKRHSMYWHYLLDLDSTVDRMDENSKIIVIEGNRGSGKEVVAQELAKRFDMLYMPEVNLDQLYVNHNGFDYRTLNKYLDETVQAVDEKMFYEKPLHRGVPHMKLYFYDKRYEQYIDALAHLYNTGQGVILERSPYSDFVFTEAMHKCGYLPDDARDYYYRVRHNSIYELQRPHLVVYLDVSVEECLKRIKARNNPIEVTSEGFKSKEYLQEIEDQYKNRFLPEASRVSEVVIYDWNELGDIDDMVDDLEKVNIDEWDPHLEKFEDWNLWEEDIWEQKRHQYTNEKNDLCILKQEIPRYDVPSVVWDPEINEHRFNIFEDMVPNYEILPSFDPANVPLLTRLLRWKTPYREEDEFNLRTPYH